MTEKVKQMERPDREKLQTQITQWRNKITDLKSQLDAIRAKEKEKQKKDNTSEERGDLIERLKELKNDINRIQGARTEKLNKSKDLNAQRRELFAKLGENPRSEFKTEEEVESEIRKLEFQLETGSGGLKREKALMKQIRDLEVSKRTVRDRDNAQEELDSIDEIRKGLLEELDASQTELNALRDEKTKHEEKLDKLKAAKEQGKQVSSGNKEIDRINQQIQDTFAEIDKARDDFTKRIEEYNQWRKEEKERQDARREAERKRRDEEREQRRLQREQKEEEKRKRVREEQRVKRLNPHEEKINICDQLIAFLGQNSAKPVQKKVTNFNAEDFAKPGMTLFKKDDEDNWLYGDRTKKKPQAKKAPTEAKTEKTAKDVPLKLPLFRDQQFHEVGLPVPKKQSEVAETLTQLKLKKEYFLSFRKTQAEVDAELDAEEAEVERKAAEKAAAEQAAAGAQEDAAEE